MPAFIRARFAPYLAILLVAVALFGYGWVKGAGHVQNQWDSATAKAEAASIQEVQRLAKVGEKVTIQYVTRTKVVHDAIQAIPQIVTPQDDARCVIPPDFERMWNDANKAGDSSTRSTDASSDQTVVHNP